MFDQESKGNKKDYEIVVNGEKHNVEDKEVTYEEAVQLAYPNQSGTETVYTVTYRGAKNPNEGSLKAGGKVEIHKQGAIFNVTSTTKS